MKDQTAFWDRLAPKYIPRPMDDPEAYERKLALTRPYLSADMNVLEIGAGSGNTARRHAPLVQHYTAMDLSPEMVRLGREAGPIPENMEMVVGDCDRCDLPPESYDMVLALSLLHLLPDPQTTLSRIAGALSPGGVFVSSTATIAHMWPLKLVAPLLRALGKVPHINFFRPEDVRALINGAGLTIEVDERFGKDVLFLIARKMG